MNKVRLSICIVSALACWPVLIWAQRSDADLFTEARVAIDRFHDCKAAAEALNEVSAAGRQDPIWIYFTARAKECSGDLQSSLELYRKYNGIVPGKQEVSDKIGELEYQLRKQNDAQQAVQQQQDKVQSKLRALLGEWQWEIHKKNVNLDDDCAEDYRDTTQTLSFDESGFNGVTLKGSADFSDNAFMSTRKSTIVQNALSNTNEQCERTFNASGTNTLSQNIDSKLTAALDGQGQIRVTMQEVRCQGDCANFQAGATKVFTLSPQGNSLEREDGGVAKREYRRTR